MKNIRRIAIAVCMACAVMNTAWQHKRTDIIVNSGVRVWNTGKMVLAVLLIVTAAIVAAIADLRTSKKGENP